MDICIVLKNNIMINVAIPITDNVLSQHFGHCQYFAMYSIEDGKVVKTEALDAPPHQPGLLPKWLSDKGVSEILAGGIGQRAIALFNQFKINVFVGVPSKSADSLIEDYLKGVLTTNENACDH